LGRRTLGFLGWLGGWGSWGYLIQDISHTEAEPDMMGILAVDMVDVKRKELVWRGQATVDSISTKQKGDGKQVHESVNKMFKQYPPEQE
jgi:hypothetical protein